MLRRVRPWVIVFHAKAEDVGDISAKPVGIATSKTPIIVDGGLTLAEGALTLPLTLTKPHLDQYPCGS